MRWGIAGFCALFALFCGYGFIASGELDGTSATAWKTGYVIAGIVALIGSILLLRGQK